MIEEEANKTCEELSRALEEQVLTRPLTVDDLITILEPIKAEPTIQEIINTEFWEESHG